MQINQITLAVLLAGSALALPVAQGQQQEITRKNVLRNDLSVPGREVIQVVVGFPPGVVAPRHSHPGEEVVYVIEGVLRYRLDGRPPITLEPGQSLLIPPGVIHAVDNVGQGKAAELATYIVEKGKTLVEPAK
jgi:quercetin dioxygenase-like cupin family protein